MVSVQLTGFNFFQERIYDKRKTLLLSFPIVFSIMDILKVKLLFSCSVVSHSFVTPWTVPHQAPLSMGFPRQETGVGCHLHFQEIFLTQGSNPFLLHWQADSLALSYWGKPKYKVDHPIIKSCHLNHRSHKEKLVHTRTRRQEQ